VLTTSDQCRSPAGGNVDAGAAAHAGWDRPRSHPQLRSRPVRRGEV